ncbi:hypothetical protein [Deinococcus sp. 6GRE01]|uniref:hypothetical protein n=1 Tax=Deinococcus sp. 6GRE01 TaxID=2745873 RepID=UPI001E4BB202|nr:hypothetical protein [Deinococcus sp. 6GRE01]MCD0156269.1 hypothetical protein [Deinococcus sp. 6GRE01]
MTARRPSPMKLWMKSSGDETLYAQLLRKHGHIIDRPRDAQGNLIYSRQEMAELILLTAARFRSAYHDEHGRLPADELVSAAIRDATAGKVAQ